MFQNSPEENKVATSDQPTQAGLTGQAQQQVQNISQAAQAQAGQLASSVQGQVQNLGQAGVQGVQDLGKAGGQVVQNLGQTGVQQVNNLVGQFTKPLTSSVADQPPVAKDEKVYGGLCYIPFFAIVAVVLKPDSAFVRLHAKQGVLLTILFMFVGILAAVVSVFGAIGGFLSFLIGLVPLASMIIGIYSMYLAFTGYWWKIPMLAVVADLIPIELIAKTSKENLSGQVGIAKADYDNRQEALVKENVQNLPQQNVTNVVDPNQVANTVQSDIPKK